MGQDRVERLQENYDVEVEWLPFELQPELPPEGKPLPPGYHGAHERLQEMAEAMGRPIIFSGWMPNSRRALEASEYAREQGKHEVFHQIVFRKFYGEGQELSDWAVLRAAAEEAGLDPDEMQRETESGQYRQVVDQHIRQAHQLGISGVPAYVLGQRYLIMGAQPYEVFEEVMGELEKA